MTINNSHATQQHRQQNSVLFFSSLFLSTPPTAAAGSEAVHAFACLSISEGGNSTLHNGHATVAVVVAVVVGFDDVGWAGLPMVGFGIAAAGGIC